MKVYLSPSFYFNCGFWLLISGKTFGTHSVCCNDKGEIFIMVEGRSESRTEYSIHQYDVNGQHIGAVVKNLEYPGDMHITPDETLAVAHGKNVLLYRPKGSPVPLKALEGPIDDAVELASTQKGSLEKTGELKGSAPDGEDPVATEEESPNVDDEVVFRGNQIEISDASISSHSEVLAARDGSPTATGTDTDDYNNNIEHDIGIEDYSSGSTTAIMESDESMLDTVNTDETARELGTNQSTNSDIEESVGEVAAYVSSNSVSKSGATNIHDSNDYVSNEYDIDSNVTYNPDKISGSASTEVSLPGDSSNQNPSDAAQHFDGDAMIQELHTELKKVVDEMGKRCLDILDTYNTCVKEACASVDVDVDERANNDI